MKSLKEYVEQSSKVSSLDEYINETLRISSSGEYVKCNSKLSPLGEYINENNDCGLLEIQFKENEELVYIKPGIHGDNRNKGLDDVNYKISDNKGGINFNVIKNIFKYIDKYIIEFCLNHKDDFKQYSLGFIKRTADAETIMFCFNIYYFDFENEKYKVGEITSGRRDKMQTIHDVEQGFYIDKNNYVKIENKIYNRKWPELTKNKTYKF